MLSCLSSRFSLSTSLENCSTNFSKYALEYAPQMEGVNTLQLTFISKAYFEKFVEQFSREVERLNREERQLSIHLMEGELPKEKWKWILENIHQCSEIKIGAKGCYALYKELYG